MAATTTPSSPLDLSRVSYDKCVASLQSRPGPIRADGKLDFEHIWTSMHMNNNSDAPIIGHTHEHFRDEQRTNCKNSTPKQTLGLMRASRAGHARVDARISGQRDARVQAWGRRVYPMHAPVDGVQASQSHLDQQLQHSTAPKCSREGAWHTTNQPKRPEQTRRTHLSSKKMRASGAQEARRMHLLAHKDARVPHTTRASGGDTRLLPSNSSAIGGSTPLRTNVGGSVLPKTDNRSSISPQTYEHDRPAQQEPSTRRKGRPRRRKSSQTRTAQLDPSTSPGPDLREQLNKKRRADQVTPHCRCERIIASVLADCTCSSPAQTKTIFERLSATISAELTKHLRFNDEDIPSEDEFIEVSVNMVDKDMGKQPALEPENSATPGVYMRTRSRSGTIRPVNYRALDQGQEKPKEHSAIVDSQSSSSGGHTVHSLAADTPEEMAQQLALQAQAQRDQQEHLRAQAQTIDTLKTLIQQVLERVSKKNSKHAGSTSHSKNRESSDSDSSIRFHSPHEPDDKVEPPVKADNQSKIEPESQATDSDAGHRMKRLEEQVAALKTTTIRQEAGATRPYPVEWDAAKYPSRFKVPTLNTFDGKGSA